MKAVVTGAKGFIGKNLVVALRRAGVDVAGLDRDSSSEDVDAAVRDAKVVFHLAGANRPQNESEFFSSNVSYLEALIATIDSSNISNEATRPILVLSSSIQAGNDTAYGRSKRRAEELIEAYVGRSQAAAAIYRLPGVFGKWCRPNYNSVVATFCHNVARDLPINVADPTKTLDLVHVDDVVAEFLTHLDHVQPGVIVGDVKPVFAVSLGELAERIRSFRAMRDALYIPDASDGFGRRLLGTYTSYLPVEGLAYSLQQRTDARGTLAELLKSTRFGQIFVSRTKPGFTRGNHYHDSKVEKFCVLEGEGVIRFRPILGDDVTEYCVTGSQFEVVDIPPGMTHSIENVGKSEMIVLFWASEILDPQHSDTHNLEVLRA